MPSPKKDPQVRKKVHQPTDVNVGKRGLTQQVVEEIRRRLKQDRVIKVRLNRNLMRSLEKGRREVARELAERVGAELVEVRGNTLILRKKESPQP